MVSILDSSVPFSRACLSSFWEGISAALSWWTCIPRWSASGLGNARWYIPSCTNFRERSPCYRPRSAMAVSARGIGSSSCSAHSLQQSAVSRQWPLCPEGVSWRRGGREREGRDGRNAKRSWRPECGWDREQNWRGQDGGSSSNQQRALLWSSTIGVTVSVRESGPGAWHSSPSGPGPAAIPSSSCIGYLPHLATKQLSHPRTTTTPQ